MQGKLIVFCAPSGAGKTTIVKQILERKKDLFAFSVSATTRTRREFEVDGKDYFFLTEQEFKKKIDEDAFVEWQMVYEGCYYGTLKSEVKKMMDAGKIILLDIDVMGGVNIKKIYGDNALCIFIMPPSIEALKQRLINRKTENETTLAMRIQKAEEELSFAKNFDKIIINDNLNTAVEEADNAVREFLMISD